MSIQIVHDLNKHLNLFYPKFMTACIHKFNLCYKNLVTKKGVCRKTCLRYILQSEVLRKNDFLLFIITIV